MTSLSPDLGELTRAIAALELGVDVFEFHGGVCGLLCTRGPGAVGVWIEQSGNAVVSPIGNRASDIEALHDLEAETWRALNAASVDFDLLLPDDDVPLSERVAALAAWCQGFVTGVGLGGFSLEDEMDGNQAQAAECVTDMIEVSHTRLTDEDLGDLRRAGFDLAAVSEHVRISVQLLFEALERTPDDGDAAVWGSTTR